MSTKVIISCAITGAMHTPTMSASLPITPAQIAVQSIDAAAAGTAIIHLHARNPANGEPTGSPEVYSQFLPQIHEQTDAVLNLTTGGSPTMSVADRLAAAIRFKPEMCSLNMGSMNFAIFRPQTASSNGSTPGKKATCAIAMTSSSATPFATFNTYSKR